MVGLQNYGGMQPIQPATSMQETLGLIQTLGQMSDQRDARIARDQAASAAQVQAEAEALRQGELRAALDAAHKNPTAENYMRLSDLHAQYNPEKAKAFRENWGVLDASKQQSTFRDSVSMLAALEINPEQGMKAIQEEITAAENVGDTEEAKKYKTFLGYVQTGPAGVQSVKDSLYTIVGMIPGGEAAIGNVLKFSKERRDAAAEPEAKEKRLADIGLTKEQTKKVIAETKLLDQELTQTSGELELAKESGGLTPEKKFASELSLNKEYEARTKAYNESLRLNSVIKDSAAAGTGAGDLALINTFMKMLDPGSVVRESEFAQAQDTNGLISKLAASLGRVQSGQVLVPAQRTEFARLANQYMTAAGVQEKKVRDSLGFIVKSYGLNPENVFGTMADGKMVTPAAATATPGATPTAPAVVYPNTIEGAIAFARDRWKDNPEDLKALDGITSEEQLKQKFNKTLGDFVAQYGALQKTTKVGY